MQTIIEQLQWNHLQFTLKLNCSHITHIIKMSQSQCGQDEGTDRVWYYLDGWQEKGPCARLEMSELFRNRYGISNFNTVFF